MASHTLGKKLSTTEPSCQLLKSSFLKLVFTCVYLLGSRICACYDVCVEVRRQLAGGVLSSHHGGSRDRTQVVRLDGKHFHLLPHPARPRIYIRTLSSPYQ